MSGQWPSVGSTVLVQDRPATKEQEREWRGRLRPTWKGEVIKSPAAGDDHLLIDTGGDYGVITFGRDFGSRYTWKYADAQRNGTLAPGEADELLRKLRHAIQRNEGSRVAPHFRDFMETFARLDKALTNGAERPSDWQ